MSIDFGAWVQDLEQENFVEDAPQARGNLWKANAAKGWFEQIGGEDSASELRGIILQVTTVRILWKPENGTPAAYREKKFQFPEKTPLCKWDGGTHLPVIHADLNDLQRSRLSELGCGNCNGCQAKAWSEWEGDRIKPLCTEGLMMLFLPDAGGPDEETKPLKIQINARTSVEAFKKFVATAVTPFKIPIHAGKVELSFAKETNQKGAEYNVLKAEFLTATPKEMEAAIRELTSVHNILGPAKQLPAPSVKPALAAASTRREIDEPSF
jgi:hypothetical protein